MPADNRLSVSVISPEAVVYEGNASQVIAPAWDGQLGVLPGHTPMIVLLGAGDLRIDAEGGARHYDVSGGFMQVVDNRVTILSEAARSGGSQRRAGVDTDPAGNPLA